MASGASKSIRVAAAFAEQLKRKAKRRGLSVTQYTERVAREAKRKRKAGAVPA